tara:strand:- start:284 stop:511 length:228 start_codon:yes stop_codon:yes gene_type:complete
MHIFRWIDLQGTKDGVLVDLFYKFVDGSEYIIDLQVHNIINNVVGEVLEDLSPMIKIAFSANILQLLEREKNKEK